MGRMILFTSLPRVGGHSTLTLGLCRLLEPHFREIEIWCKTMPEHGHSEAAARKLEEMGCRVIRLNDDRGKWDLRALAGAVARSWRNPPDVFFALAMRHLSLLLALLVPARNSVYYHITHDLNLATLRRLRACACVFHRVVFICPATYDAFPGAARDPRFAWVAQSSEIPVRNPEALADERRAVPDAPMRFGLLGRLTQEKGSAVVLSFVDHSSARCGVHVAGSGPFAEAFRERAESPEGRPVSVTFHGTYDPAEREAFLRGFFAGIDWLLVPSQDEWETLSMVTLEALQHGVPALICRSGGLVSFAHPELGPAPASVVHLVEREDFLPTLEILARQPREPQSAVIARCREYYEANFSDQRIRQKWLDILMRGPSRGSADPLSDEQPG